MGMKNTSDAPAGAGRLQRVTDLIEIAGTLQSSTVLIAGGYRVEDLQLVESARDHGIIDRIILVGNKDRVKQAVDEVGIEIAPNDIIDAGDDESIAAQTVEFIKEGGIDIVLKGGISTPIINRHIIRLAVRPTVSVATIVEASPLENGKPIVMTDAGVTTVCNFGRMVNLIENAVEVARIVVGIDRPRVAVLSANEKQIPSLPSTSMGRSLAERQWLHAFVCGPLSFDLAVDPESVNIKGMPALPNAQEVAGRADVLVCPGIDAANILYKIFTAMSKFGQASMACITVGFPIPYIILSRADTLETRLLSIALCSIYAQRTGTERKKTRTKKSPAGEKKYITLVINPGSTSIKLALFENETPLHELEITHTVGSHGSPDATRKEIETVRKLIFDALARWKEIKIDAIAARGGFVPRPPGKLKGGIYTIAEVTNTKSGQIHVDNRLVSGIIEHPEMAHASNLGIPVAAELAEYFKIPAYVVDPVVVDEFIPEAEISGFKPIRRLSTSHALSVHAASRKAADLIGRPVEDVNLVVAHLGGGITVAAVKGGRMTDGNIALLGDGPFTPNRAGTLPLKGIIELCFSGKYTRETLIEELSKRAGLYSYLGTFSMEEIEERIERGDEEARLVVDALIHRIVKEIGSMYAALGADVEAVVFTGGLIKSRLIRDALRKKVSRMAPIFIFEGSLEMEALAGQTFRVLSGRINPLHFPVISDTDGRILR